MKAFRLADFKKATGPGHCQHGCPDGEGPCEECVSDVEAIKNGLPYGSAQGLKKEASLKTAKFQCQECGKVLPETARKCSKCGSEDLDLHVGKQAAMFTPPENYSPEHDEDYRDYELGDDFSQVLPKEFDDEGVYSDLTSLERADENPLEGLSVKSKGTFDRQRAQNDPPPFVKNPLIAFESNVNYLYYRGLTRRITDSFDRFIYAHPDLKRDAELICSRLGRTSLEYGSGGNPDHR